MQKFSARNIFSWSSKRSISQSTLKYDIFPYYFFPFHSLSLSEQFYGNSPPKIILGEFRLLRVINWLGRLQSNEREWFNWIPFCRWIKLTVLSWEANKWSSALPRQEMDWGRIGYSGLASLNPSSAVGRRRLMGGLSVLMIGSLDNLSVPVWCAALCLWLSWNREFEQWRTAMETTKHWGLIPSVESPQGNLLRLQGYQKLHSIYPLKEVNFVTGTNEITDGSGPAFWNLISSPPLCLVTMLSISCNVVLWTPFRY